MTHPKIDFLKEKYHLEKPDEKPFLFFARGLVLSLITISLIGIFFSYKVSHSSEDKPQSTRFSLFSIVKNFVLPEDDLLDGEKEDRVNFLLTGIGGEGHQGPQLTDTILSTSYRPSTGDVAFLSLPRDMTAKIDGYGYQKINHVNAYAEAKDSGSGGSATAVFVGNLLKQPIHYYMRVDFSGFAELIDVLGGVDVVVDHPFTDPAYPIIGKENDSCGNSKESMNATAEDLQAKEGEVAIQAPNYDCRYQVLTFKEGPIHMDGETALAFVRSRHGNNGEGSDFARSRRQQKIMLAAKERALSASTFLNPVRITQILNTLDKNISTNLSVTQLMRLGKSFKDLQSEDVVTHVIDDSPTSPLYATNLNGAYVLLPKNDDWSVLQQMAEYVYAPEPENPTPIKITKKQPEPEPKPAQETEQEVKISGPRVEIQNGTTIAGLASKTAKALGDKRAALVTKVGNALTRDYDQTLIFDLTNGTKPEELASLQSFLGAKLVTSASWQEKTVVETDGDSQEIKRPLPVATDTSVDFFVILGQSAQNIVLK